VIALLETHRAELAELCARFGVERLEVFGSAVRPEDFGEDSDIDFIVLFGETSMGLVKQYFGFKEALEALFGREVDLLQDEAIENPYFRRAIAPERVELYAA